MYSPTLSAPKFIYISDIFLSHIYILMITIDIQKQFNEKNVIMNYCTLNIINKHEKQNTLNKLSSYI